MKRFWGKILACLLSAGMVLSLGGVTALAAEAEETDYEMADYGIQTLSDTYTSETYNHGNMAITSADAKDNVITLAVGGEADLTISPYAHVQYKGCDKEFCPDECYHPDHFQKMYGCQCETDPVLRYASVTAEAADDSIVSIEEATADGDAEALTLSETLDGTLTLTGRTIGTTTVTVATSLRDWVSATETFTVVVEEAKPISVTGYEAWTTVDEDSTQRMHFEFSFDEALICVDSEALVQELKDAKFTVGGYVWGNGSTGGELQNVGLSSDGKTLHFEVSGYEAPYDGEFVCNTVLKSLVTAGGRFAEVNVDFFVPNGLTTETVKQVVGSGSSHASVTTRFVSDKNTTRAMIHLTVLLNGEPVNPNIYGATAEGHWHDYLSVTPEEFCAWYYEDLQVGLGDDWSVTYSGDTMTVEYLKSSPGDVVDLHITSYLNTNYSELDTTELERVMAQAESALEKEGSQVLRDVYTIASVRLRHSEHYSQEEIDYITARLQDAIEGKIEEDPVADIEKINGVWTYTINGVPDYTYTGFGTNSNGEWYVKNGQVLFNTTDIIKDTKGALGSTSDWYYVIDSKVQTDFIGLSNFSNANGWWYIDQGKVDFSHNGVDKNKNGWWYVTGGKVQFGFTGLANYSNANGWWYIKSGKVDFSHNGVDKNKNGWWYVTGGKVQFGFTGLANYKNDNGWWYIKSGKVDFSHNGVDKNKNGWWYVTGSKVQFGFTGLANYKNAHGWWYIQNGKVDFSYDGYATNKNGTWYLKSGKVQFGYSVRL